MQHLLTLEEALKKRSSSDTSSVSNNTEDTEDVQKLSKIGKAQSYFDKEYKENKKGNVSNSDIFLAGENNFIIDKSNKLKIDDKEVYVCTDDYDKDFIIYIDDNGIIYTDQTEKSGLFKKILQ